MLPPMDIRDQYDRIVAGDTSDTDIRWSRRQLQLEAFRNAAEGGPEDRLGALRVAEFLGASHGLPITATLVTDADRDVRTRAFHQALAAGEDGRPLLRDVLSGPDPDLALVAADLLADAHDRPSLNIANRLVASDDPRMRAAAARILGCVGGMSSLARMRPEAEADADARAAMEQAVARIRGDSPRPEPRLWWEGGTRPVPALASPAPPAPEEVPETLALPAPIPTADSAPEPEPTPAGGAALPNALPDEPRALCRLLGVVDPAARAPVIAALGEADPADLGAVWIDWPPGGDLALGKGLALAATALGRTAFLSKATRMATDPRPELRAEAYRAMGALGGASTLVPLQRALVDDAVEVRAAAAEALGALGERTGRDAVVRGWLQAHPDDDDAVRAAITRSLERLA